MITSTNRTALIIGATGLFGLHAAEALIKHGWRVRALARDPAAAADKLGPRTPIEWVKGDAMDRGQRDRRRRRARTSSSTPPTRRATATGRARCCR